jgi:hypothetical protein
MEHKLFNQLHDSNVPDDEIRELYEDLKFVLDNPFDAAIEEATSVRGAAYVEISQPVAH